MQTPSPLMTVGSTAVGSTSDGAEAPPEPGATVRVDRTVNPLLTMSPEERARLFIRVLCELVAYEPAAGDPSRRLPA